VSDQEQSLEQEILADAHRRAERAVRRAEAEAERVLNEARAAAERERERLMQAARRRAERQERMQQARLGQELQRLRRQAFQDVIDSVRDEAQRELAALCNRDEAREMLVRLAVSAIGAMRGDAFRLYLRAQDAERWGTALAQDVQAAVRARLRRDVTVRLAEERLNSSGGLVVRGEGTSELVDQTFEARMDRFWEDARERVAEILNHVWDGINGSGD